MNLQNTRGEIEVIKWPQSSREIIAGLEEVATSGRWSVSGRWPGVASKEKIFGEKYSKYNDSQYGVPTSSGSAGLEVALESLDIGFGDEVIVPGITWVATASTILSVNAIPILVDVDPYTACLDIDATEKAITDKTKAIVCVHLFSSVSDLTRIMDLCDQYNLSLIEDCSQSHGAEWKTKKVGSIGHLGVFSLQNGKILTSGEGGIIVTSREDLYLKCQQLRADGRIYDQSKLNVGEMELIEKCDVYGNNRTLSEFHAAILLAELEKMEERANLRIANAAYISENIEKFGFIQQHCPTEVTTRAFYQYAFIIDEELLEKSDIEQIRRALTDNLGFPVQRAYKPLSTTMQYQPLNARKNRLGAEYEFRLRNTLIELKNCQYVYDHYLTFHHCHLLGDYKYNNHILNAFKKTVLELGL
jgi:dTDP-4-amino-4,6-dideoxygalactose transaminase